MKLVLTEQVADREVVELDTYLTDDTCLSPTERELQLVVTLLLQSPVHVNGSVLNVWLDIGHNLFRVEESH